MVDCLAEVQLKLQQRAARFNNREYIYMLLSDLLDPQIESASAAKEKFFPHIQPENLPAEELKEDPRLLNPFDSDGRLIMTPLAPRSP